MAALAKKKIAKKKAKKTVKKSAIKKVGKKKGTKTKRKPIATANKLTEKQIGDAFALYVELGSIAKVSTKSGLHAKTLRRYRAQRDWDKRREVILRKAEKKSDARTVDRLERNTAVLDKFIIKAEKKLDNEELTVNLDKLPEVIKTQTLLIDRGASKAMDEEELSEEGKRALVLLEGLSESSLDTLVGAIVNEGD